MHQGLPPDATFDGIHHLRTAVPGVAGRHNAPGREGRLQRTQSEEFGGYRAPVFKPYRDLGFKAWDSGLNGLNQGPRGHTDHLSHVQSSRQSDTG